MKYILSLFLLLSGFCITASAQQTTNIDNALLLDYYQNQRFTDAYNYLKATYPEPVTEIKALSNLAYTAQMSGKLADAETYYQRVYDKDSSNVATLFSLGSINVSRGNNLKAINYYKKILLRDSTNFNVYKQLANLSQNVADTANYSKYLQKANAINPQEPDVAYDLDLLYVALKKYDKAASVLDKAIQADTANLLLQKGKAQVTFLLKKYLETISVCMKLIQAGDKQAAIVNWLGISYFNLKQYKQCIAAFQLSAGNMQYEATFYYIGMSYKALKDQVNAITFLQKAITDGISPNINNYYSEIADSYEQLHFPKNALTAYQKSLQFKDNPLIYYLLGNLYDSELKNRKNALRYYKKFLAAKPNEKQQTYVEYSKSRIAALNH
ncbi:MAG: tetratricopeptide repeat protein [Mucilaginibacter sp.]|nr:tetratricopeptide repeat protein [Mucilaginibacter sp.]